MNYVRGLLSAREMQSSAPQVIPYASPVQQSWGKASAVTFTILNPFPTHSVSLGILLTANL